MCFGSKLDLKSDAPTCLDNDQPARIFSVSSNPERRSSVPSKISNGKSKKSDSDDDEYGESYE